MRRSLLLFSCAALLLSTVSTRIAAQQPPPTKPNAVFPDASGHHRDDDDDQSSSTEEMLKRVEIKHSEDVYKENLARAREAARLSADVCETFKRQHSLADDDLKKLARIEKNVRSIRNDMNGGDDDTTLDDPPKTLADALERLADLTETFRKQVEKTPRLVVSASVITAANQLIALSRLIKTFGS